MADAGLGIPKSKNYKDREEGFGWKKSQGPSFLDRLRGNVDKDVVLKDAWQPHQREDYYTSMISEIQTIDVYIKEMARKFRAAVDQNYSYLDILLNSDYRYGFRHVIKHRIKMMQELGNPALSHDYTGKRGLPVPVFIRGVNSVLGEIYRELGDIGAVDARVTSPMELDARMHQVSKKLLDLVPQLRESQMSTLWDRFGK